MYKSKEKPLPSPTYMSEDQMGQPSPMSPLVLPYTPPKPSRLRQCTLAEYEDLHDEYAATYLKDLRTQRLSRPSGSRPPPPSKFGSLRRTETAPPDVQTNDDRPPLPSSNSMPIMPAPRTLSHRRAESDLRIRSPFAGRALARPPSAEPERPNTAVPEPVKDGMKRPMSMPYLENGMRWMEKQEARSLRVALEDMDLEEETKVHTAAQDEAADLVWKHQNPGAAFANPEAPKPNPDLKRDYRSHMRRGSYQRSHSQDQVPLAESRKSSAGSYRDSTDMPTKSKRNSIESNREVTPPTGSVASRKSRTPSGKSYGGLAEAVDKDVAHAFRRTSGGSKRIMSGEKKMYMHRNDRIWEDPQEGRPSAQRLETVPEPVKPAVTPVQPPSLVRKNPFARVRMQQHVKLDHSVSAPVLPVAKHNSIEIQRNPPTQSRKADYMSNEPLLPTPPSKGQMADEVSPKGTPTKDGKEIRSDDLRAATSKQRKDRSPKLPQPTMVSDKPGRPIVSFQQNTGPKEVVLEEVHTTAVPEPSKTFRGHKPSRPALPLSRTEPPSWSVPSMTVDDMPADSPPIPTIVLPDEPTIPSIVLPEEPDFADPVFTLQSAPTTPAINIMPPTFNISGPDDDASPPAKKAPSRPLPTPTRPGLPHHAATTPVPRYRPHTTPYTRQTGILCAHCALPIAGRILSAAGERFHPHCFVCHECHTNLELVAFYPEPDKHRTERCDRIQARQTGLEVDLPADRTQEDLQHQELLDGDSSLRFYCHLDFHELFSPRCKSCKTPIEGEVIVACGAEWHSGHFFCAQCGDPFDSRTPFVEKDGYAWCVGCHTNRYSSKCRKCRKPVTDLVVKALGSDWHEECFVCLECGGDFTDGRYFLRGESQDPVCVRCEERRLKA